LIATAVTLPLVVLALLGIAAMTGQSDDSSGPKTLPAITAAAPPHANQQAGACAKVLAELPLELGSLDPRIVHTKPDTPYVVAWGDPAVVLSCGVDKPKQLFPGSGEKVFSAGNPSGPYYILTGSGGPNVYTIIDRAPFVSITVPAKYRAAGPMVQTLIDAVGKALPKAVCHAFPSAGVDPDKLCTRRTG
jgi:hypothetical protein